MEKKQRIAILTSHPIQYQAPLFRKMAEDGIGVRVYFCWRAGFTPQGGYYDNEFGRTLQWDVPLLHGYAYAFLRNYSVKPSSNFWGQINFGIVAAILRRDHAYDAILVFGWNSFTNWLAFMTAFILKTPVLLRGENPLSQELLKSPWKIKIKKIILGWLFRRISAFLYIGEENRKFYKHYGVPDSKLFFVPYAVDNERFMRAAQELGIRDKELRKKMKIKNNDTVILFVGKLTPKKRPMDLLQAYQQLTTNDQQREVALVFVGDGELRASLREYAKENNISGVHFVGFKNQTEIPAFYAMADIFVLPSGYGETWGLVVNEAMCFGLPVIVSDIVGCVKDLVTPSRSGYVFPCGNKEKLAFYLNEMIRDPRRREAMGKASLSMVKAYSYKQDSNGIFSALSFVGR